MSDWTDRPTLAPGGYPDGDDMERILDQISALTEPPALFVRRAAAQAIANATFTDISWDTEDLDLYTMFAPTAVTWTYRVAGLYVHHLNVLWAASATNRRTVIMRANGGTTDFGHDTAPGDAAVSANNCTGYYQAAVGDTGQIIVRQDSGGALNVAGARLGIWRVR